MSIRKYALYVAGVGYATGFGSWVEDVYGACLWNEEVDAEIAKCNLSMVRIMRGEQCVSREQFEIVVVDVSEIRTVVGQMADEV